MKNKEDLRIRRTHKLLCDAMFSLLEKKSFDEISVVEICDKAMVHRATFYKHFEDKYRFMEYVMEEKLREFYLDSVSNSDADDPALFFKNLVVNITDFLYDNKKMLKVTVSSGNNSNFYDSIHKTAANAIRQLLEAIQDHTDLTVPPVIASHYCAGGLLALIKWWIESDSNVSKDDIVKYFEMIIKDSGIYLVKKSDSESE